MNVNKKRGPSLGLLSLSKKSVTLPDGRIDWVH